MNTLERVRAAYPIFAAALEDMFWKVAGHRRFAKTLARKAGLRSGTGDVAPQTIIAGYVHPFEEPFARTYLTDLTACRRVAFSAQTLEPLYILIRYPYNITDVAPLQSADDVPISASAGSPSGWVDLSPAFSEAAADIRLMLSTNANSVQISAEALGGPFEVLLEAD